MVDPAARVIEAEVLSATDDGVSEFVAGDLGRVDPSVPDAQLNAALTSLGSMFKVKPSQLQLQSVTEDDLGYKHFRFSQVEGDRDVIGADFVVHIDSRGSIYAANGNAHSFEVPASKGAPDLASAVFAVQGTEQYSRAAVRANRPVYLMGADKKVHEAIETVAEGFRGQDPFVDYVYVAADDGQVLAVHPRIHFEKTWKTYDLNHSTTLPGTLVLTNNTGTSNDQVLKNAHAYTSNIYDMYKNEFGRNSIDGADMAMISSVHYSTNYVNAFWNGSQMTYGDGDGTTASALVTQDIAGHEITHGVTERTSNLTYSGESGGMNEANSDIFGAVSEWIRDGKTVTPNTWLVGEDCWTPGTPGDALRYMNDPAKDGTSRDRWSADLNNLDPHYNSGPGNLMFYLVAMGGKHPRGLHPEITVEAAGFETAAKIFFRANTVYLTSSSRYKQYCTALTKAAQDVAPEAVDSISQVCTALDIPADVPPPPPTNIENNVPVPNLAQSAGEWRYYNIRVPEGATKLTVTTSGGTGDADVYIKWNGEPSQGSNDGKSEGENTNESVVKDNPSPGVWTIGIYAWANYSGVTLLAVHDGVDDPDPPGTPTIENGVPITGLSDGGERSSKYYKTASIPARSTIQVTISGGTGDADLYVRKGKKPTLTKFICAPRLLGNEETCTVNTLTDGVWYLRIRQYNEYSGVTVKATWGPRRP